MSSDANPEMPSALSAFLAGLRASFLSVFVFVLVGTYVGIAALAHDYGFSLAWVMASTVLVWAGPSQVILISALGAGATLLETAIAVGLSCVRFLPMVVALLPLMRGPKTRTLRSAAARAFHRRQHVGGIVPPVAGGAARAARRLLQRARRRLHAVRARSAASSATS